MEDSRKLVMCVRKSLSRASASSRFASGSPSGVVLKSTRTGSSIVPLKASPMALVIPAVVSKSRPFRKTSRSL
jgi:hypothetical protein